jgi:hypothetical protein
MSTRPLERSRELTFRVGADANLSIVMVEPLSRHAPKVDHWVSSSFPPSRLHALVAGLDPQQTLGTVCFPDARSIVVALALTCPLNSATPRPSPLMTADRWALCAAFGLQALTAWKPDARSTLSG